MHRWTIEACEAIEEAHRHEIIHCDLKPGNILLDGDGHVSVTDFGLARSLADETRTDEGIEGTAAFMAPEQVFRVLGTDQTADRRLRAGCGAVHAVDGPAAWIWKERPRHSG